MDKFLKNWNGKTIEDCGCYTSEEWKSFARAFKNAIKRECEKLGYSIVGKNSFSSKDHYFISGFISKDGQTYYISYDYDRYNPVNLLKQSWAGPILWRRTADEKDYRGENNHFTIATELFFQIESDYERRTAA